MESVFKLEIISRNTDTYVYPIPLFTKLDYTFYSSLENAKAKILEELEDEDISDVLYFKIREHSIDKDLGRSLITQWYDAQGNLIYNDMDSVFLGKETYQFNIGDLVQFYRNDELRLGIVYARPYSVEEVEKRKLVLDETDDVYLIDELEGEHDHILECFMSFVEYPLSPQQERAYEELKQDVLHRIMNNNRAAPKNIKVEE